MFTLENRKMNFVASILGTSLMVLASICCMTHGVFWTVVGAFLLLTYAWIAIGVYIDAVVKKAKEEAFAEGYTAMLNHMINDDERGVEENEDFRNAPKLDLGVFWPKVETKSGKDV